MDNEQVDAPKKVNIPLIVFLIIAVVAIAAIFLTRSSPKPELAPQETVPSGPAPTNTNITKPQSPERSSGGGGTTDSSALPSGPPSTQ